MLCAALGLWFLAATPPPPPPVSTESSWDPLDEAKLAALVWQYSPEVIAARQDLLEAESARTKSYLLPNPTVSAAWGTIPIGERNGTYAADTAHRPPGFWDVPNYSVGVSELFEIGKRRPRQQAAEAGRRAARFGVMDVYARNFFAVLESLSDQAAATARAAVLEELVSGSEEILRLQSARAERGDVAALEVDRLRVDHLRQVSSLREAQTAVEEALADCTRTLPGGCPRFANQNQARQFLMQHEPATERSDDQAVAARPDLQALRADRERLNAELTLAQHLRIPDPVAGLAYTHDQYLSSGNQGNSLTLSLTLPLPLFDHGQAETARTRGRLELNELSRQAVTSSALRGIALGRRQLSFYGDRARSLDEQALPLAQSTVERMAQASRRGGVALQEVLLTRRAFEELQLDRIDVAARAHRAGLALRRATADLPWPASAPVRPSPPAAGAREH